MAASLKLVAAPAPDAPALTAPQRSLLRFITCGSVDDGKSTLLGRLLFETGAVFDDQLAALDRDSARFGTTGEDLDFALLVDGLSAEREQGITIDVAYRYFATPQRAFIAIDTPGHEQYTRNMATGASNADVAIILIDARKGILPQTRRHSYIVSMLGVRRVIVAVNKIDLVGYDEGVFRAIERDYRALAASLGFIETQIVPVSARYGDNVTTPSPATPWRTGPSLLGLLEKIEAAPVNAGKFQFPVQWVNRPNSEFRGFSGTIASGDVAVGDRVVALPRGLSTHVDRIIGPSGELDSAGAGEAVTLTLADEIDISRGDVLVRAGSSITPRRQITARLLALTEAPVAPGRNYLVKIGAALTSARIAFIHHAVDVHSYDDVAADALPMNAIGLATLRFETDVVAADYADCPSLGGLLLIDPYTNDTVALGVVENALQTSDGRRDAGAKIISALTRLGLVRNGAADIEWRQRPVELALGAALIGLILLVLSGSFALAIIVAVADLALRPLTGLALGRLRSALAARRRRREDATLSLEGGSI